MSKIKQAVRKDPGPRVPESLFGTWLNLDTKNRHYVCVDPSSNDVGGKGYYEALGYEVEMARADGPRCLGGARGSDVSGVVSGPYGTVLMSCPIDVRQDEVARGQALADAVEKKIRRGGDQLPSSPDGRLRQFVDVEAPRIETVRE